MKRLTFALAVLVMIASIFAVAFSQAPKQSAPDPESAIRNADEAWAKAIALKSVKDAVSFYDADAVTAGSAMPAARGLAGIEAMWTKLFSQPDFSLNWKADKIAVTETGSIAYSTGVWFWGTDIKGPYLAVWRKQPDGKWKALIDAAWYFASPTQSIQQSSSSNFKGVIRGKSTRQLVLPAPDKPNHVLGLVETEALYEPVKGSEFLSGASVRTIETWDLVGGSGSDRGFMTFTVGKDILVASYTGQVKPAEKSQSAISGELLFETGTGVFLGIKGNARYTGLADPQSYELQINGNFQK
jgi:ketosteroid isomerase-like protein